MIPSVMYHSRPHTLDTLLLLQPPYLNFYYHRLKCDVCYMFTAHSVWMAEEDV